MSPAQRPASSPTSGPHVAQLPTSAALGRRDLVEDVLTAGQSFLEGGRAPLPARHACIRGAQQRV